MLHVSTALIAILIVGGLIVTMGASAWQISQAHFYREEELRRLRAELARERRAHAEETIQILLDQFVKIARRAATRPDINVRSCVFLPQGNRLAIVFHSNMRDAPDLGISFERWQGCTDQAWADGRQTMGDLSRATEADLHERWKLSPMQIRITNHLKSILSTPIFHPQNSDIILGVLSIDSDADMSESRFDQAEFLDAALQVAEALAHLLLVGGIAIS